jgi:hypothetical protein
MRRPGTDENNVQMSDVLCDFCRSEWTEERPMVEGHKGSCICGRCASMAYAQVVRDATASPITEFFCVMCLESSADRAALNRGDEPGWSSAQPGAVICRRCIKMAAAVLTKDKESGWRRPA